ncbi:MAG: hypothetical protein L0177_13360, partial [Chloroflexi bacterium]|nr:hypothetical protein [Chloroflexota bacterium]
KVGHSGMVFRDVADRLKSGKLKPSRLGKVYFAGFNALTKSEELVLSKFVEEGHQRPEGSVRRIAA